jgi:primosomal replication protein N''
MTGSPHEQLRTHEHKPVLDAFIKRLIASISQSPLLRSRPSKTGRLLDCFRLDQIEPSLPRKLFEAVINGTHISVQLDLSALAGTEREGADPLFVEEDNDEKRIDDPLAQEQLRLYHAFERMSRDAELVKRETGRHALWLGYPLLYATAGESDILAPVFLWPIFVQMDLRHQGRVRIGRAEQKGLLPPRLNRPMAEWIHRNFGFQVPSYGELELAEFNLEAICEALEQIGDAFHPRLPKIDSHASLVQVPASKELDPRKSPRFYNSAVMGHFRWQNEAILADLEALQKKDECVGVVAGFVSGTELPKPVDVQAPPEEDRFLVHDADFSQERVIWQARTMPGLVVHGPPGTGKSQTIVNIIADALAHGRTVLMVCQKQAATRVVLERLRAVRLEKLCLEVHDVAADRQRIFQEIRKKVDELKGRYSKKPPTRSDLARQITENEKCLDEYARAFHGQHPSIGLSYKHALGRERRLLRSFPTARELRSLQKPVNLLSVQQIDEYKPQVEKNGQLFRQADPLKNCWRDRQPTVLPGPVTRSDVMALLEELRQLDADHFQQVENHGAGCSLPDNSAGFDELASELIEKLRSLQSKSSFLMVRSWSECLSTSDEVELRHKCERALEVARQVRRTSIDPNWTPVCAGLRSGELGRFRKRAERVIANRRWSLSTWWAKRSIQKIRPRTESDNRNAAQTLLAHMDAAWCREELASLNKKLIPRIAPAKSDEKDQLRFPEAALRSLEIACWLQDKGRTHDWIRSIIEQVFQDQTHISPIVDDLERCSLRFPLAEKLLSTLTALESFLTPQGLGEPRARIRAGKSIGDWIEQVANGLDRLQPLIAWESDRPCRQPLLREILEALERYEEGLANGDKLPLPHRQLNQDEYGKWWSALVEYATGLAWQRRFHSDHPSLYQVTPEVHENTRQELTRLLSQKRAIEAETICEYWLDKQLQYRDRSWPRMFQLKSSNQHKAPRLREAVEMSLSEGLLAMYPCWLVNPEAAAQIFPLQNGLFDVVIFDEASQCPIEQAVPAIYRGKTLIVSGDEKQLPPTDFFSAKGDEISAPDADVEEQEATDEPVETHEQALHKRFGVKFLLEVEDLLGAAIGNLQQYWLRVHYRSEHPDLIEFSNHAFYNFQLEAPPSRFSGQGDHRPITYLDVKGLYSRRTNRQEAAKVVQLLKDFWKREGAPTIGVVTFNRPQRELIEDLIEEECLRDEAFAVRYEQEKDRKENNQDVGFFVKNLENVQGDERDVMIFSTTFGRDSSGRFYRKFGPLGLTGGERRLNVAVTRAKKEIFVVTSMPINEISDALKAGGLLETGFRPRDYLQLYLAYAQAVSEGNSERRDQLLDLLARQKPPKRTLEGPESPFEEEVLEVLQEWGYLVHPQVGESGFRIDLAVLHPDPARGYILGIECDGAPYHSERSARIRDVWREQILRSRGWRLHRIWSSRWWDQRAVEMDKLKQAILDAAEALSSESDEKPEEMRADANQARATESQAVREAPMADTPASRSTSEIEPQVEQPHKCVHCGDPAFDTYKGKPICLDCYNELARGVVPPASKITHGGVGHLSLEYGRILEEGTWDDIVSRLEE